MQISLIKRRQMLRTLGLATASTLLPFPRPQRKLGVALVGLGRYSTGQLGPALQHTQYCQLSGIVTGTPEKAEKWSQQYGITKQHIYNYENFDRIADDPDIDIVYVVLPNAMHAEFTIRAARAGKHVICEKPMAISVAEGKAMIEACRKAERKLQIGYRLYYEPHHLEVRKFGLNETHGTVKLIEASLGFAMADPSSWRLDKALGGGGAIVDLGVYCIQGARRSIGQLPVAITAQGFNTRPELFKGIREGYHFQLEFPDGIRSNHTTTYTSYFDRLYVATERSWYELRPAFTAGGARGDSREGPIKFEVGPYQQIEQMDAFARSIIDDVPVAASGEEGLLDLQILQAIFEADRSGERVLIKYD